MAFTAEQRREWRQRPEVKRKDRERKRQDRAVNTKPGRKLTSGVGYGYGTRKEFEHRRMVAALSEDARAEHRNCCRACHEYEVADFLKRVEAENSDEYTVLTNERMIERSEREATILDRNIAVVNHRRPDRSLSPGALTYRAVSGAGTDPASYGLDDPGQSTFYDDGVGSTWRHDDLCSRLPD